MEPQAEPSLEIVGGSAVQGIELATKGLGHCKSSLRAGKKQLCEELYSFLSHSVILQTHRVLALTILNYLTVVGKSLKLISDTNFASDAASLCGAVKQKNPKRE